MGVANRSTKEKLAAPIAFKACQLHCYVMQHGVMGNPF